MYDIPVISAAQVFEWMSGIPLHLSSSTKQGLLEYYLQANPLIVAFAFCLFISVVIFFVSEYTQNFSQVDRLWSILPTFYTLHFVVVSYLNGYLSTRLLLHFAMMALWSLRLTFNYWRKGGYEKGSEDYRWVLVRSKVPKSIWHLFNFLIISVFQNVLLLLLAAPSYLSLLVGSKSSDWCAADIALVASFLICLCIETTADEQQFKFYSARERYRQDNNSSDLNGFTAESLSRGFNTDGLFRFSRHPNFLAEQSIWVILYLYGSLPTGHTFNWTIGGVLFLIMVFQISTQMTEDISSEKYPHYDKYKRVVGRFFPKINVSNLSVSRWTENTVQ